MSAAPGQLTFDYTRRPSANRVAFWNTSNLTAGALKDACSKARHQDVLVLSILRGARGPMTPSEVWRAAREAGSDMLLTSVRRSMNTLTRDCQLTKLGETREGPYGRPERLWCARQGGAT
jgi:hypothetical protein